MRVRMRFSLWLLVPTRVLPRSACCSASDDEPDANERPDLGLTCQPLRIILVMYRFLWSRPKGVSLSLPFASLPPGWSNEGLAGEKERRAQGMQQASSLLLRRNCDGWAECLYVQNESIVIEYITNDTTLVARVSGYPNGIRWGAGYRIFGVARVSGYPNGFRWGTGYRIFYFQPQQTFPCCWWSPPVPTLLISCTPFLP
jgi:hypothetical protein